MKSKKQTFPAWREIRAVNQNRVKNAFHLSNFRQPTKCLNSQPGRMRVHIKYTGCLLGIRDFLRYCLVERGHRSIKYEFGNALFFLLTTILLFSLNSFISRII